jgi:DNA-binding LacI/PurR family transcriptional regulator
MELAHSAGLVIPDARKIAELACVSITTARQVIDGQRLPQSETARRVARALREVIDGRRP